MTKKEQKKIFTKKIRGEWWLPKQPQKRVHGKLAIGKRLYELRVNGKLLRATQKPKHVREAIVFGIDSEHTPYTLENCRISQSKGSAHDKPIYGGQIWPEFVYSLIHVEDPKELKFKEFHIQMENLLQWTRRSGFEQERDHKNGGLTTKYKKPKPVVLLNSRDLKVTIEFSRDPTRAYGLYSRKLEQNAHLEVHFSTARHAKDAAEMINYITRFFVMASDKQTYPSVVSAKKEVMGEREPYLGYCRIYSKHINSGIADRYREHEALFSLLYREYENEIKRAR